MSPALSRVALSACVASLLWACPGLASAQDADALAKQLSNPIASLTSVPMQLNWDTDIGAGEEGDRLTLNVQPVVPIDISENWNMISRTIVPITSQWDVVPGDNYQFGLGDTVQSLFFSPKALTAGGWTWGVGPVFLLPTATDDFLGTEKWGAGPTAVALRQTASGWSYGVLANHIWSFAGSDDRQDVNATYLQPFVSKSLGQGRTVSFSLESTKDWENEQWTVPFNMGFSKVSRIGKQLVSYQMGLRYYLDAPDNGPEWGLRATFTLLYPRSPAP